MCIPIALGLGLAAAGVSAAGSLSSASAGAKAHKASAAAFEQQAIMREQKGAFDAQQAIHRYDRNRGQTVASIGTTGLSLESFSDVLADSAVESALEVKAIKYGAKAEADNLRFQAAGQRVQAKTTRQAGTLSAVGTMLGAGAKAYGGAPSASTASVFSQPWSATVTKFGG